MIHFHSNIFVGLYLKGYICTKKRTYNAYTLAIGYLGRRENTSLIFNQL